MIASVIGLIVFTALYGIFFVMGRLDAVGYSLAGYAVCALLLATSVVSHLFKGGGR